MIDKVSRNLPAGYTREAQPIKGKPDISIEKSRDVAQTSTEVKLSEKAQFLQKVMKAANDAPEVRDDVVSGIKYQIETGTYKIDHARLAEQLLPKMK